MKKQPRKPLALSTETVRKLQDEQLALVPGGRMSLSGCKSECCSVKTNISGDGVCYRNGGC